MFITVARKSGASRDPQVPLNTPEGSWQAQRRLPGLLGKQGAFTLECRRGWSSGQLIRSEPVCGGESVDGRAAEQGTSCLHSRPLEGVPCKADTGREEARFQRGLNPHREVWVLSSKQ